MDYWKHGDWHEENMAVHEDHSVGPSHYRRPIVNWADNWNRFIGRGAVVRYVARNFNYVSELLVLEMREIVTEYVPQEIADDTEILIQSAWIKEPTIRTYNEGGFVKNDIKLKPFILWLRNLGFLDD